MSTVQPIDVRDMTIVHRTFRSVHEQSATLVRAVPAPSPARATSLADHIDFVIAALHHDHEGEDALLYPRLIERVPEQAPATEQVEYEHLGIETALEAAWRQPPSAQTGKALAAAPSAPAPALWFLPVVPPASAPWSRCNYRRKSSHTAARRGRAG